MLDVKEPLIVPENTRFIGDWVGFKLPEEPTIINKQLPGCGFTQWCIDSENYSDSPKYQNKNKDNIILCSPRKILLQNKYEQFPNTFLVKNDLNKNELRVDKDVTGITRVPNIIRRKKTKEELLLEEEERKKKIMKLKTDLSNYILHCQITNKPAKILVTYDSFRLVKEELISEGVFDLFYVVIDEFQSIFIDSSFKSDTEMEFMDQLKDVKRLCYVSATPMLKEYLDMLPEFDNIPYYVMDWKKLNSLRIIHPVLDVRPFKSLLGSVKKVIQSYLDEDFKILPQFNKNGEVVRMVESKEAVFYVNSVKNILGIIKNANLTSDQVNILCSDTEENRRKIREVLGKGFTIGKVPLRGEPRKMFTFCTRTVYLGADFHSDNARTFIFSDANLKTLKVDISLDLPQILGRQRDETNPWHNRAEFFFKVTSDYTKFSKKDFTKKLEEKVQTSKNLLQAFKDSSDEIQRSLAKNYQKVAKSYNYSDDYVAVNVHNGVDLCPEFNRLVMVSEMRAFEIQQIDYASRINIFSSINRVFGQDVIIKENRTEEIIRIVSELSTIPKKLKYLVSVSSTLSKEEFNYVLSGIDEPTLNYIAQLGLKEIKACGYNIHAMRVRIEQLNFNPDIVKNAIYSNFEVGDKYSLSELKDKIGNIYKSIGYTETPRAIDITKYFDTKDIVYYEKLGNGKRKQIRGYELLKKLF